MSGMSVSGSDDWEAVAQLTGVSEVELTPAEIEALPPWDPRRVEVSPEEEEAYDQYRYPDTIYDKFDPLEGI